MSDGDRLLSDGLSALRSLGDCGGDGGETRDRVLAALAGRERRRRQLASASVALAVMALGGTVLAATGGGAITETWGAVKRVLDGRSWSEPRVGSRAPAESWPSPTMPIPPPQPVSTGSTALAGAPPAAAPLPITPGTRHSPPPTARSRAGGAPSPRSVQRPVTEADLLFRDAHETMFVTRDARRALSGWESYLAAAPRGRFAPEAEWNRALCLVRLGLPGAGEALAPFADGARGDYRRREARALLAALARKQETIAPAAGTQLPSRAPRLDGEDR